MKLIIGLGNPGQSYKNTRHNIGFLTIDDFAKRHNIAIKKQRCSSLYGERTSAKGKILLIKPQTFMNLSGDAVRGFVKRHKVPLEDIMVVCDDVNLDFGCLRIRQGGSSGGHHGLESIISVLKTGAFSRLRIGVGGAHLRDLSAHVLEPFNKSQLKEIEGVLEKASDALDVWINHGITSAMNKYNSKKKG